MTQKATDYWFKPRRYGYGAVFAFIAAGLAVGHALGGPDRSDAVVLAIACANRNPGLAIGLAASIFPEESFAGTAIIYALVSNVAVTLYTRLQRRRAAESGAPAAASTPAPEELA